jgi:hypothetical protein
MRRLASVPVLKVDGTPELDTATGLPKWRDVIPDRVIRHFVDHQMGLSGRYVVDTDGGDGSGGR